MIGSSFDARRAGTYAPSAVIAARLNSEGVPTRTGKPWHGFTINGILTARKVA